MILPAPGSRWAHRYLHGMRQRLAIYNFRRAHTNRKSGHPCDGGFHRIVQAGANVPPGVLSQLCNTCLAFVELDRQEPVEIEIVG